MPFSSSCRGDLNEECLICEASLEYLDADEIVTVSAPNLLKEFRLLIIENILFNLQKGMRTTQQMQNI